MFDHKEYDRIARSDCFVCRIIAGKPLIPNVQIVYEDAQVIAFLNQFPTQAGYTLVCPKRHVERFEADLSGEEWGHLQGVVQRVAQAVAEEMGAIRMYMASLGSPERNAHLHIHVCPCPPETPFEQQQFAAMQIKEGRYLSLSEAEMGDIAGALRRRLSAMKGEDSGEN